MARPAKTISGKTGQIARAEKEAREAMEKIVRGPNDKIRPDMKLTAGQKRIFKRIVKELESADILSNLDKDLLTTASIAIDRLQYIENAINLAPALMWDKNVMSAKDKYTKDFFRCCNELCLSPQARAKFSISAINKQKAEKDPLLEALLDDEDEEA